MPATKTTARQRQRLKTDEPAPRYKVIIHNDDTTTMQFVVEILTEIFFLSPADAQTLMMKIHTEGSATAGTYDYDTAISKVFKVRQKADQQNFPLRLTVEKE